MAEENQTHTIESVLEKYREDLLQYPNVVSVGISEIKGEQVIIIFVEKKVASYSLESYEMLPKALEGFKTEVCPRIKVK